MKRTGWMVMLLGLVACSDSHDRSPGSQTHFVSCESDNDCDSLGGGFACSAGRCEMVSHPIQPGAHDAAAMFETGAHDSGTPRDAATVILDSGHDHADSGTIVTDSGMSVPICNGSNGYRFGVFDSGTGLLPPNPTGHFLQIYGGPFAVIDGDCRFYASLNPMNGIVTGTLSTEDAAQLASDVDWDMFLTFGQFAKASPNCADGGGYITGDGHHSFACLCGCDPAAPPSLSQAQSAATQWLMRLAGDGMGVDGAVSAVATVFSGGTPPAGDPQAWPLSTPINDIVTANENDLGDGMRFDDANDAKALRVMRTKALADVPDARQIYATDGTQKYLLYVRDELDVATNLNIVQFRSAVLTSSP